MACILETQGKPWATRPVGSSEEKYGMDLNLVETIALTGFLFILSLVSLHQGVTYFSREVWKEGGILGWSGIPAFVLLVVIIVLYWKDYLTSN